MIQYHAFPHGDRLRNEIRAEGLNRALPHVALGRTWEARADLAFVPLVLPDELPGAVVNVRGRIARGWQSCAIRRGEASHEHAMD